MIYAHVSVSETFALMDSDIINLANASSILLSARSDMSSTQMKLNASLNLASICHLHSCMLQLDGLSSFYVKRIETQCLERT